MKSNVDFHCRRCLEGENGLFQSVLLKKVVIEPSVKLECVPKFCYLGDTLGAEGGEEEASARVRVDSDRMRCVFSVRISHRKLRMRKIAWDACVKSHAFLRTRSE